MCREQTQGDDMCMNTHLETTWWMHGRVACRFRGELADAPDG